MEQRLNILGAVALIAAVCAIMALAVWHEDAGAATQLKCTGSSIHMTIGVDRHTIVLTRLTVCSDGTVYLTGRRK